MIRENNVGAIADVQALRHGETARGQAVNFLHQRNGIQHHAVADDTALAGVEHTRRHQMQHKFFVADFNGVAGIVAALRAHHPRGAFGQNVNDFAFAFIAPLGAD